MGRSSRPEEVAELIAFLASDRASNINAKGLFDREKWYLQKHSIDPNGTIPTLPKEIL